MKIQEKLADIWGGIDYPFLIHEGNELRFSEIVLQRSVNLSNVCKGDVVAIIGDFNPSTILTFLQLIDIGVVVVPLTIETKHEHEYFFESALVDVVVYGDEVKRRSHNHKHELIENLKDLGHAGLILFSTGTTGRPKAILHDLSLFLKRFETPRPTLRTINFLLFDHIGGINTLLHTLFNKGVVVAPESRSVDSILETCRRFNVEVLPTTPTFLRMMLMSDAIPSQVPDCLKVITYGTERMDQPTLDELCHLLPNVDFRQTFGMSELGIVRVKSKARDSLYMRVGGEGVETRVIDGVLQIRSSSRMLGYLNAPSPFDDEGWYDTKDVVEEKDGFYKVTGRTSDVINVGGLKFMASEVERVALQFPNISLVKVIAKANPITGQHVELLVQPSKSSAVDKFELIKFLKNRLQAHMVPKRIQFDSITVGHRFKKI
jgi:acyl-coenzyme A synthetase/AMP-(fatty) acid ligase